MHEATTDLRFCSVCARQAGLDPAGSAYSYSHVLAVESPLPWPISMYNEPGVLPRELIELRKVLIEAYERGAYVARVERDGYIDCIHTTGEPETYPHPQYSVTRLERIA